MNNAEIKHELDRIVGDLESKGVTFRAHESKEEDVTGLGDVVESTLKSMGITEERFKKLFNLKECNCSKRKKWLNNLLSWHSSKKDE